MSNFLEEKLKQIDTENYIWVIYLFIIGLSWYSNYLEKKYFIYNDQISKQIYHDILIFIFTVLLIIYLYFLNQSIESIKNMKGNESTKNKNLNYLSFYASLLLTISGIIFLYVAIVDKDINVELAFN